MKFCDRKPQSNGSNYKCKSLQYDSVCLLLKLIKNLNSVVQKPHSWVYSEDILNLLLCRVKVALLANMDAPSISPTTARELTVFIQNTFQQLQDKLNKSEDAIVTRFNATGKKIDQIEKSLVELMDHAGVNEPYDERQSESELSDTYQDEKDWKNEMGKRTDRPDAWF